MPTKPKEKAKTKSAKTKAAHSAPKVKKQPKLSKIHKPEDMSLEDWQRELRRQFAKDQNFKMRNLDDEKFFSEFEVTNPESGRSYRLIIRGNQPFENYCSCLDFATNSLGTCKHIEFALYRLETDKNNKKEFDAAFKKGFHPEYSEIFLHYGMQRQVRFRPGTECEPKLAKLVSKYFDDEGNLTQESFASFDVFLNEARKIEPELHVANDAVNFVAEVRDSERRRKIVEDAFPKGIGSPMFKDLIKAKLYDYQKEGSLFAAKAGRCLIGDEMGLGKTIQSLAATEIMAKLFDVERVLIVCPTSLKHQWAHEISKFVDRSAEVIGGTANQRKKGFATDTFFKIMNYDTVGTDLGMIGKWEPDLVILDEAQRIKNWETKVAKAVKLVHSPYAIVLTGTPLENRLEELISITQFVDHHRLGPTFKLLHEHQIREDGGRVVGYKDLDEIGRTLEPVLIRRQKKEVLDQLPERIDSNIFVPMTPEQREIHGDNFETVARVVGKWRKSRSLSEPDQRRLMIALERMRMSCDNTYLVDHQTDHGPKADECVIVLEEILEDPEAKVVIFSQWLRMHELLTRRLEDKPWGHVLFHGGLNSNKRKELVEQFRNDPNCRIFMATDAGGVGLNLQFASVCMNMDLPWNPAVLEQRIGRVHRMGQKSSVRVVNFVAQGSIEEGMLSILKFKKSLFEGILDHGEKDIFLGDRVEQFIEQVEAATDSMPKTMVEDAKAKKPDEEDKPEETGKKKSPKTKDEETAPEDDDIAMDDLWTNFLQAGVALMSRVVDVAHNGSKKPSDAFVKVPAPSPEVIEQMSDLLEKMRK